MVKKLSCVSHGSLKRFPHTFTSGTQTRGSKKTFKATRKGLEDECFVRRSLVLSANHGYFCACFNNKLELW